MLPQNHNPITLYLNSVNIAAFREQEWALMRWWKLRFLDSFHSAFPQTSFRRFKLIILEFLGSSIPQNSFPRLQLVNLQLLNSSNSSIPQDSFPRLQLINLPPVPQFLEFSSSTSSSSDSQFLPTLVPSKRARILNSHSPFCGRVPT